MYELMKEFGLQNIYEGFMLYGTVGLMGAIIQIIREKAKFNPKRTMALIILGAFVGFCIGSFLTSFTDLALEARFAACSVGSVYSEKILNQGEKLVKMIPNIIKSKFNIKE